MDNNNIFKKALGEIKGIRLSRDEKSFILERVLHEGIKSPYWSPYSIIMRVRENKLYALSFAIILLVSGGGSVVLAAERSVPGDILYPIKVKISEPALDKLYVTAEENARWQGEKTARRLREAETLAIQGKLDEEKSRVIEEKIKEHTEEFRAVIQDISTTTESETRESVEVEYESKVKAHSMILSKIKENNEEEAKPTIQHVENTLSTELQRNETRKEERVREKKEKEREETPEEVTKVDLDQRLLDAEKSIEATVANIKKGEMNLRDFHEDLSKMILEESDKIMQETRSRIREARETRDKGNADEAKTISDIEDSNQKVFETNTMLHEMKKIDRPARKEKASKEKREERRP